MAKSVEYPLVTATVGASLMLVVGVSWAGVAKFAAVFAHIAHVVQVNP